jgi:hypothetical protein
MTHDLHGEDLAQTTAVRQLVAAVFPRSSNHGMLGWLWLVPRLYIRIKRGW